MALAPTPQQLVQKTIHVGQATVQVEVADTELAREQGLSDRAPLAQGAGMLFVFDQPDVWGIWMKDMRFSLDIIYADDQGMITTIIASVSPNTYPKIFYPSKPARYVVELPAGFVAAHDIATGDKIVL